MDPFKDQKSFKISEEGQRNLLVQKKFRENFFAKGFVVKLGKASKKLCGGRRLACRSVFLKWKTEVSAIKGGAWGPTLRSKCLQSFPFFGRLSLKQKRLPEFFQKLSLDNLTH